MRFFFPSILLLGVLTLISCKEKNKSIYEGCCGTEPTVDTRLIPYDSVDVNGNIIVHNAEANVFIPNVFVPGAEFSSTLNLTFRIGFGLGVYNIVSAVYTDPNGELLFKRENYYPNQDDFSDGWDGTKPDGSFYYGPFNYRIEIEFIDGQTKVYSSTACAYKCSEEGFPAANLPQCVFPSQNNGNGLPDQTLPGESLCF